MKKDSQKQNMIADTLALKLATALQKVQHRFARTMNQTFQKMTSKQAKWMIGMFVLVCGGYSLYLIGEIFLPATGKNTFSVEQIHGPAHLDERNTSSESGRVVDEQSFHNIQAYRLFLDSLRQLNQPLYERLLTERPGLLDSMKLLEDIYYSQQNSVYEK